MNTKFIGIKDFRQNISSYAKKARTDDTRFIIMSRNKPLFEVKPFSEDVYLDSFVASVAQGEADIAAKKYHTEAAVLKELGLT